MTKDVTDSGIYALLALRNFVDAVSSHCEREVVGNEENFEGRKNFLNRNACEWD